MGKGKYVFDIGCEQHGEYIPIEQVRISLYLCTFKCVHFLSKLWTSNCFHYSNYVDFFNNIIFLLLYMYLF